MKSIRGKRDVGRGGGRIRCGGCRDWEKRSSVASCCSTVSDSMDIHSPEREHGAGPEVWLSGKMPECHLSPRRRAHHITLLAATAVGARAGQLTGMNQWFSHAMNTFRQHCPHPSLLALISLQTKALDGKNTLSLPALWLQDPNTHPLGQGWGQQWKRQTCSLQVCCLRNPSSNLGQ